MFLTPVLVFDIETIPDIAGLRRIHGIDAVVSDEQVAAMAFQRRRQTTGNDFLPLHLHASSPSQRAARPRQFPRVVARRDQGQ
jgi:predicted PolB exonuclease-like 3'-5' exonuclease